MSNMGRSRSADRNRNALRQQTPEGPAIAKPSARPKKVEPTTLLLLPPPPVKKVYPQGSVVVVMGVGGRRGRARARRRLRGFSLFELFIALVIVGVLGSLMVWGIRRWFSSAGGENKSYAEEQAKLWAQRNLFQNRELPGGVTPNCLRATDLGTDRMRCSISVPVRSGDPDAGVTGLPRIYSLSCASAVNLRGDEGCSVIGFPQ